MRGCPLSISQFRFTWIAILLFAGSMASLLADDAGFPVLSLVGNKRFSTPEILLALQADQQLLSELARTSDAKERTDAMVRSVQAGYVQCGNMDANVSGEYSEINSAHHIRIEEGAAIQKQRIEFVGVEPELANRLCFALKKSLRKQNEEWIPSLDGLSLKVREMGKDDPVGKDADLPGLGGNRYISPANFGQLETFVRDAFARNGFARPVFSIEERIDRSEATQTLVFHVSELGTPTKIQEVRFSGLRRHDPSKLSESLGLRAGQAWTVQEMLRVQRSLYESGRFQHHSVYALPPLFEPSQAIVVVQVIESERLPLFYESLAEEQEKLRKAALDLTGTLPGDSVLGEYFHRKIRSESDSENQAMAQSLVTDQGFFVRVGTLIDSIPFGALSIAGKPKADKTGKTTHFAICGNSKAFEGPILRVAPFAFLEIEGEFSIDNQGCSVFTSSKGTITWKKDDVHVEKLEMHFDDEAVGPMIRLTHLDARETEKRKAELTNVGVRTSFVLRDAFAKLSWLGNGGGWRCFTTGANVSDWDKHSRLLVAKVVERSLGADSVQYELIRECILDHSRFASEFELKLTKYENSKTLGPISLAMALYFSAGNRQQCIPLSEMAMKRLNRVSVETELEELFARSEFLRELTRASGNLILNIPEDVLSLAKKLVPGNPLLENLEQIISNPQADFKAIVIDQICQSVETNRDSFGKVLMSFTPTSPAPLHWAAQGSRQISKEPAKESAIKLPR